MLRLGFQLSFRSGREALVRAVMIALAVAIGTAVLLSVLAAYHAYQVTSNRACWECTSGVPGQAPKPHSELWNYSENLYGGHFIEELGVASLSPGAPVIPGISRLPGPGDYYMSPALSQLVKTVPRDQLGDRFPGKYAGTIGHEALSVPNALVAVVGYRPSLLAEVPGTQTVDHLSTEPDVQGTTGLYRLAFEIGAAVVLFPLLVLINTATRLSAARREERFASMRLVGATPRQIDTIASVESSVSASAGALLGILLFLAINPLLAEISFSGAMFFPSYVHPTLPGYLIVLLGVPIMATVSAVWSLRRVKISPLGVSRRVTPPRPKIWRLSPLAIGVLLFVLPLLGGYKQFETSSTAATPVLIGTLLIMIGLVSSGSWLTMQAARVLGKTRGAPALLAARRLADNPKGAFRAVGGVILAVFVGSVLASLVPVFNAAQTNLGGGASSLANVLRVPYQTGPRGGLAPRQASLVIAQLRAQPGTVVLPIYANPDAAANQGGPPPSSPAGAYLPGGARGHRRLHPPQAAGPLGAGSQYDSIVNCSGLASFPPLGHCARGATLVYANVQNDFMTDTTRSR